MRPTAARPGTVTALGNLACLVALLRLLSAVSTVIVWLGHVQQIFDAPISNWYWVTRAALSVLIVGILYIFRGTGFPLIALSVMALLLNNTRGVRDWHANP